jgi:hypothetical protein
MMGVDNNDRDFLPSRTGIAVFSLFVYNAEQSAGQPYNMLELLIFMAQRE